MKQTLWGFIIKEFLQALRDTKMRLLIFGAPLIQMTIFGLALSNEVQNIRILIVNERPDVLVDEIREKLMVSGWFVPTVTSQTQGEILKNAEQFLRSGKAEVVMIMPREGLSRQVQRSEARIQVLLDSTNLMRARVVENYIKQIVGKTLSGGYLYQPVQIQIKTLYNPTYNTAHYLVPGVMCMLICLITILLTSMSIVKEKENGTFEMLISSPISISEILMGKTIPFIFLGCMNVPLIALLAVLGFDVPIRGSIIAFTIATIVFVFTTVSIGTLISTICRTQQQAMMASLLFLFPSILLSGFMFPIDNMPVFLKFFAYLNPLTYFVGLLRNILLKGGDLLLISQYLLALLVMAIIMIIFAVKRFRMTLS